MLQLRLWKILLAPIALLYGLAIGLRNGMYRAGILQGISFSVPTIAIGNLSVGGSGKTPHTEYLIRALRPYLELAVLSRGYRRSTRGFKLAGPRDDARSLGDEPYMYALKYPDIKVAVSERRAFAIPELVSKFPALQAILLDDAYQHRAVEPYINILLTPHDQLYSQDYLLPVGRLREWRAAACRADIIIVTKCPDDITEDNKSKIIKSLNPLADQQVFFSGYRYHRPYLLGDPRRRMRLQEDHEVLLVSAIARTEYLVEYLDQQVSSVDRIEYEDHHYYTGADLRDIIQQYDQLDETSRIFITTEKDATRFYLLMDEIRTAGLEIWILPTEVVFHGEHPDAFLRDIQRRLMDFKV